MSNTGSDKGGVCACVARTKSECRRKRDVHYGSLKCSACMEIGPLKSVQVWEIKMWYLCVVGVRMSVRLREMSIYGRLNMQC